MRFFSPQKAEEGGRRSSPGLGMQHWQGERPQHPALLPPRYQPNCLINYFTQVKGTIRKHQTTLNLSFIQGRMQIVLRFRVALCCFFNYYSHTPD